MSSDPIERAAERIGECCDLENSKIAKIIRDELFPVVKREDVEHNAFYWTLFAGIWTIEVGYEIQHGSGLCDEIRGPVPFPE